jgi:lipopolysaccharide/colanic/teichoic acid biosynthesis glycosyltransferase
MFKFRTMPPGPASGRWTETGDRRVGGVGRWLRKTHLDELPQVINILRGDLATVGPRPEQPHYVAELNSTIPFYAVRHLVRPGLTGWAQVNYSYGSSELDALEKLRYDLYYLQHQSLAFDLRILVRSLRNVMRATGR